jgi:hypothetical protein
VVIEAVAVALPSKVAVAAAAFADAKDLVVQQPAEKTALTCEGTAAAVAAAAAAAAAAADDDDDDDAAAVAADVVAVDVKTKIDLNVEVPTSQLANFASSEFAGAPT